VTDPDLRARVIANLVACAADPAASLTETARELRDHELVVLPSPKDTVRFLKELSDGLGPGLERYGDVKMADVPEPTLMGTQGADGFVVLVFTSDQLAREHAVAVGALDPDAAMMFSTRRWLPTLREFREDGFAGLIVDEGTAHRAALDRAAMERLWAALERDRFETAAELYVVARGSQIHVERRNDGFAHAFAYLDKDTALQALERLWAHGPFDVVVRAKPALRDELRAGGVERLHVEHGFTHQHVCTREQFDPPPGGAPQPPDPALATLATGDAEAAAAGGPTLVTLATSAPVPPAVEPPADDETSRRRFKSWQKRATARTIEVWQFVEALSYEVALWVSVSPEPYEGLRWPLTHKVHLQPENAPAVMVYLFTTEAAAAAFVAERPPEFRRLVRLSGIEAFRWIWAHPGGVSHVSVDYPDEAGWITFPVSWLRDALLPLGRTLGNLSKADRVALPRLGALPAARGLKPEVLRALVGGWKPLTSVKPADDGTRAPVELDGGRYLPVFTEAEQFFAFSSAHADRRLVPEPADRTAPFARWLEATRDLDGIVLDPAGPHPLPIDRTALLVLDACVELARFPGPGEFARRAAGHHAAGRLSEADLGRAAAEIPVLWMGLGPRPDDAAFVLHVPDDPDTGVLFTTEADAEAYLSAHGMGSAAQAVLDASAGDPSSGVRAVARPARWFASPLSVIEGGFERVVIDPAPDGSGGCRLGRAALVEATRYLRSVLQPRVDGFVWTV